MSDLKTDDDSLPPPPPHYSTLNLLSALQDRTLILCSSSPRRTALLTQLGLPHTVQAHSFPEQIPHDGLTPWEYVLQTATAKCLGVWTDLTTRELETGVEMGKVILLAADTIVLAGHKILEKPSGKEENMEFLRGLRGLGGVGHKIVTAVVCLVPDEEVPVAPGYVLKSEIVSTTVVFDETVADKVLEDYVASGDGLDKAGGYGIQGDAGGLFVKEVVGSFENCVGLPMDETVKLIEETLEYDVYQDQENINM